MNELTLSSSSLNAYLACPRRYYLGSVLRRPEAQNVSAAIGTATHAGIEALHRGNGSEAALDALDAAWATEAASVPAEDLAADPGALSDAEKMLRVYEAKVLPVFQPTLIEEPFSIRLHGVRVTGVLDAADDDLHDTKTTAGKTMNGRKPTFRPGSYVLQMSLYAAGFWIKLGRWPRRYLLDVLTRRGAFRQYEIAPDFGEMRTVIEIVRDGITAGRFEPTGAAAGKCHFCPFRLTCSASTYQREMP